MNIEYQSIKNHSGRTKMKLISIKIITGLAVLVLMIAYLAAKQGKPIPGEAIFKSHCSMCHPKGGNRRAPDKPLKNAKQLDTFKSFLSLIRNPPIGMSSYSSSVISDKKAKELYDYILEQQKHDWK